MNDPKTDKDSSEQGDGKSSSKLNNELLHKLLSDDADEDNKTGETMPESSDNSNVSVSKSAVSTSSLDLDFALGITSAPSMVSSSGRASHLCAVC